VVGATVASLGAVLYLWWTAKTSKRDPQILFGDSPFNQLVHSGPRPGSVCTVPQGAQLGGSSLTVPPLHRGSPARLEGATETLPGCASLRSCARRSEGLHRGARRSGGCGCMERLAVHCCDSATFLITQARHPRRAAGAALVPGAHAAVPSCRGHDQPARGDHRVQLVPHQAGGAVSTSPPCLRPLRDT
jgi:hypothetical protein